MLHPDGIIITSEYGTRRLVSIYGAIRGEQVETHTLVLASHQQQHFSDPKSSVWTLKPDKDGAF
jgi:hypothetical protein